MIIYLLPKKKKSTNNVHGQHRDYIDYMYFLYKKEMGLETIHQMEPYHGGQKENT